ncbi:MAG: hypothetical protein OQK12_02580 [Motiliproteus sp.]|nr:hypothetical protein [Motiliproteus sp.]MCW9053121.1 hypothetical protein [Motiliproteus sp.]
MSKDILEDYSATIKDRFWDKKTEGRFEQRDMTLRLRNDEMQYQGAAWIAEKRA